MMNIEFSLLPVSANAAGAKREAAPTPVVGTPGPDSGEAKTTQAKPAPEQKLPDLKKVLETSSKLFQQHRQHLSFSVDEASGRMVVSVIDSETSELIRQIPGDEVLAVSRRLQQMIEENMPASDGLLVKQIT